MKTRSLSIKMRIAALGVVLCLGGLALRHFIALPRFQQQVQELFASQQRDLATHVARDVEQALALRAALVRRHAADLPAGQLGDRQAMASWLTARQHSGVALHGTLALFGPSGALLASSAGGNRPDSLDPAFVRAVLAARDPVLSDPLPAGTGRALLQCQAVPGGAALLCGVGMLGQGGFLDELMADQGAARSNLLLIGTRAKLFLSSSDPAMILRPTPPPGVNLLHDRAMAGYRGTGLATNARGIEELAAMAGVARTDWFVVARLPASQAFAAVEDMRSFMMLATGATAVLIMSILLFGLSIILRPLLAAARAIREMGDGKRPLSALPMVRDDEVGKLVRVFNQLVERLRKEEAARHASEARLLHMAHHDPLTGLYNRAMLEQRLEQEQARCARNGLQMAVLFCDLDGFKAVNDRCGHRAGDAVLHQVGARLSQARRRVDAVARLGGDEFVIVLSDLPDGRACATIVAEQCMGDMTKPFDIDGGQFYLGMSIGIAVHRGVPVGAAQLLAEADAAMYQAKRLGKGMYCFAPHAVQPGAARAAG